LLIHQVWASIEFEKRENVLNFERNKGVKNSLRKIVYNTHYLLIFVFYILCTMNRLFALAAILALFACGQPPAEKPTTEANPVSDTFETEVLDHADWSKNATIYEVNLRQHTAEGTIAAFRDDLPRLNKLGVKILWLMPVHPIGLKIERVV